MKECISKNIVVESEYPSCSHLFRRLRSPTGNPSAQAIETATLFTNSSKLEDISRFFHDASNSLGSVGPTQAAELLKPLQNETIFPITNGPGEREYDSLLDLHNINWFIADNPSVRESFHGKLPLLALPIKEISMLQDLFHVLKLYNRILSKLATSQSYPKGRMTTHWAYTSAFRQKRPFIKALIPSTHHDRKNIKDQIDNIQVSVVTGIFKIFILSRDGATTYGNPVPGEAVISRTGNFLHLIITEECAAADSVSHELVHLIAEACGINESSHLLLLHTAISNSNLQNIHSAFAHQGIYIEGIVFNNWKDSYRAQGRDLDQISSHFWDRRYSIEASFKGPPTGLLFGQYQGGRTFDDQNRDRRLPMTSYQRQSRSAFNDIQPSHSMRQKTNGWDHVQYLGENMFSKVLQNYLESYDPERDWTSYLRTRSGYKPLIDSTPCAAFTIRDPEVLQEMTSFAIKYGHSQTPKWKETLQIKASVYHIDLVVSEGSQTSSFVINSSQIERMRHFRMNEKISKSNSDVAVVVKVSDVYTDNLSSVSMIIDPWRLFDSGDFTFENDWILRGVIREKNSNSAKKRFYTRFVSRAIPEIPGSQPRNLITLRDGKSRENYSYTFLDSGDIRLICLLPGDKSDQLHGVITHVRYESTETYQALSYVWGSSQRTEELFTPDGVLQITSSLSRSLQGLRHKNEVVVLWVDAICINQDDNIEKAQQIRLLPEIFQNASLTFVFLEGNEGSDAAIEMLMQVREKVVCNKKPKLEAGVSDGKESEFSNEKTFEDWPKSLPMVPASWSDRHIPLLDDAIWTSVRALFDLSWFRRVWIIQEVVAARTVRIVCGEWVVDWSDLHLAMEIVDREFQLSDNFSHMTSSWKPFLNLAIHREWEAREHRWCLIMLLEYYRYVNSTLSRDRLFALLGLASDGNDSSFEPDYDSSLKDILLKFSRGFIHQGRGMQLLYRAGLSHDSCEFPSWIPDWTVERPTGLYDSSDCGVSFEASKLEEAEIKCDPDKEELVVKGYTVDVIKSVSRSSNVQDEWKDYFEEIDTMIDSAELSGNQNSRKDLLKWKVPIAGALYPKIAVPGDMDLKLSYKALRSEIDKIKGSKEKSVSSNSAISSSVNTTNSGHVENDSSQTQGASYIAALQDTLHGWRFVVTEKGYTGVVPNYTRVGDIIVVLKGGRVPFILRKSTERPKSFRLIGECYIHGIMHGESLSWPWVVKRKIRIH
ncbi:heterokaryon incompatibility protein-domain-containing protein [Xylogone sp. PMI_703]|nr:heterokaryon incompatibility protein-domain-containing protein [Xylogone sp. PMI_703]